MTAAPSLADTLPRHWQLKRLKFIARVQTGVAKGKDHADADTVEVPYLRVANVQDGYLALDDVATMAVPVADLERYRLKRDGGIEGIRKDGETPTLNPITDNGLREARDREKTYFVRADRHAEQARGKDVSDADQVALAVYVSEKLRGDAVLMAQVQNNPKDQAMRADLPGAAVQALFGAMTAHQKSVTHLLSDEESRRLFLDVVYQLLTADRGAALMQLSRVTDGL